MLWDTKGGTSLTKLRIGLIHATMNSVAPIHRAFSMHSEDVDLINFMDEGLIYELNTTNKITTRMILRLCELAGKAVESNVDAILFTCSSFTPYISRIASLLPVPVLPSDISMLQEAVKRSANISIVATVQTAAPTTKEMLFELAKIHKKKIKVNTYFIPKAFHDLQKGNESGHDKLIQDKIDEIDASSEVIILAQYSMARAVEKIENQKVLTGPRIGADHVIRLAKEFKSGS